jgi:hypothetical protein
MSASWTAAQAGGGFVEKNIGEHNTDLVLLSLRTLGKESGVFISSTMIAAH